MRLIQPPEIVCVETSWDKRPACRDKVGEAMTSRFGNGASGAHLNIPSLGILGTLAFCLFLSSPIIRFEREFVEIRLVSILLVFRTLNGDVGAVIINLHPSVAGTEHSARHVCLLL